MNSANRRPLNDDSDLDYFDAQSVINELKENAWQGLPFTSKVLAENLLRKCPPERLEASLWQLICLLYTSPSPRDKRQSRMPSSA